MRRLLPLSCVLVWACIDIEGMEQGEPCNSQGVCAEGLFCEEGVCRDAAEVSWERMNRPGTPTLYGVWGTDPNNVYAAGSNGTILHYQGQGLDWVDTKQQESSGTKASFTEIWGTAPNNIWAVGNNIVHFDGSSWRTQKAFDLDDKEINTTYLSLTHIHGEGDQVYAVGSTNYQGNLMLKYDAASQSFKQIFVGLGFRPLGVRVVQGHVFAVGDALHIKHFDGQSWQEQNLDLTRAEAFNAVWGTGLDSLLAVGPKDKVLQYDGQSWKTVSLKRSSKFIVRGIAGTSLQDFYLVGDGGVYPLTSVNIERCTPDCSANLVPEDAVKKLYSVWVSADGKTAYAVGGDGIILRRKR